MKFARPSELLLWSLEQDLGSPNLNDTLKRYYASFARAFGPVRRRKYDHQLAELTEAVRSGETRTVLDAGCGCGTVSLWLALQGAKITAIDLKADRLEVAVARAKQLGVMPDFRLETIFDTQGEFDAIWLEQAFHHIEPRREAFSHIASLLKLGGRAVISDSNAWNPLNQIAAFKVRGFATIKKKVDSDSRDHLYGDERITTPSALARGIAPYRVRQVKQEFFGVLPNNAISERIGVIEDVMPSYLTPAFTHYLWVGERV